MRIAMRYAYSTVIILRYRTYDETFSFSGSRSSFSSQRLVAASYLELQTQLLLLLDQEKASEFLTAAQRALQCLAGYLHSSF